MRHLQCSWNPCQSNLRGLEAACCASAGFAFLLCCPAVHTVGLHYLDVAGPVVSPSAGEGGDGEATMAYGVDSTGDEVYTL